MQAVELEVLHSLPLLLALLHPLRVRLTVAQREALGDLVAVTLALVQPLDEPQGLLEPDCVETALAVREGVLQAQAVAVLLCVLQGEPVEDLLGLPLPLRVTEVQGLAVGDLEGEVLPEEQRVAVAHTLTVALALLQEELLPLTLSLTLAL